MAPYSMAGLLLAPQERVQHCGAQATTALRRPAASSYLRARAVTGAPAQRAETSGPPMIRSVELRTVARKQVDAALVVNNVAHVVALPDGHLIGTGTMC